MNINGVFPAELMMAYVVAAIIATLIDHIAFASAVMLDTILITALVPRWIWALATLLGGPLVAGLYWIIHRGVPSAIAAPLSPLAPR